MGHRTREDWLKIHALLWGGGAFWLGVALTMFYSPAPVSGVDGAVEQWLGLHGFRATTQSTWLTLYDLTIAPTLLSAIGTLLVANGMYGARNDAELLKFGAAAVAAYILAGLAAVAFTGAFPIISGFLSLVVVGVLALWLGSVFISKMPLPIFGIVGLGGIALIGLILLTSVGVILAIAIPLAKPAVIGAAMAIVPMWVSENLDF